MYNKYFKDLIDFLISGMLLLLLSPLLLLVGFLVKITSEGPIFFKQQRLGKHKKKILVYKFRTMTNKQREVGKTIIGKAEGVTSLGFYLRRFKIDELPQLINVIKGEMSLVGPRPNVEKNLAQMTPNEMSRYEVKPGLTGLAQVSGNIHLPWKKRFEYDLLYINNQNFKTDWKIIVRTVLLIFVGEEKFKNKELIRKR